MMKATALQIRRDDPAAPHVAALLDHHLAELRGNQPEFAFALDATGLSARGVTFWTAWDGDHLAGFAALKSLDSHHGEVKSMRAAPGYRGKGIGRALLAHIIAAARARGLTRLSLETGTTAAYTPAITLYRAAGFHDCPAFADYAPSPHNQFLTLAL